MPGILLAFGYTALLLYLMRRSPFFARVPGLPMRHLAGLFLLKIAAGTALWAVYTWVYTDRPSADVYKYFDDSAVMYGALHERPGDYLRMLFGVRNDTPWFTERYYSVMNNWFREYESNLYNDAHTVIRFNALLRLLSFGEFHVHTVFASFAALTGMTGLYRAFVPVLPGRERALAIAVFLVPSTLFWASGPIKESLLFLGLGLLVWLLHRVAARRIGGWGALALAFSVLLLFTLKFYVLFSLVPALALLAWSRWRPRPALAVKTLVVCALFVTFGLALGRMLPGYDPIALLALKQKDFIGLATATGPGSYVPPPPLEPEFWSFVRQAPHALWTTLLGPLVHAQRGAFGLLAAVENLALVAVIGGCLWYRRAWSGTDKPLLLSLLLYATLLALVIGWTTPVMGAVVRYRAPLLPFLLIAALLLLDQHRLLARWPKLKPLTAP